LAKRHLSIADLDERRVDEFLEVSVRDRDPRARPEARA
jgi:hypothetical protein